MNVVLFQFVVRSDMLGEVIAAHELLVALRTLEALLTRMRSSMSLQFIRSCEPFPAVHPRAHEGSFTWKNGIENVLNSGHYTL